MTPIENKTFIVTGKLIKMKSVKTSSVYSIDLEAIEALYSELGETFQLKSERKQLSLF